VQGTTPYFLYKISLVAAATEDRFFSIMARSVLRRIRVASKNELKARIIAYLDDLNREPVIHKWTYKIDTVA
jgi:hypothetical protein